MSVPPAESLAVAGIGFVVLFAAWKSHLAPYLARRRAHAGATGA